MSLARTLPSSLTRHDERTTVCDERMSPARLEKQHVGVHTSANRRNEIKKGGYDG